MINNKVIWSEGMFMKPHHFQQWDRFHEYTLNFKFNSLSLYPWGARRLKIDSDGIANGSISLLSFSGLLLDGLAVNIPDHDEPPQTREFKTHFTSSRDILDVYLATPAVKSGFQNCSLEKNSSNKRETRFEQDFISVVDDNTGKDEHQIAVAKKRVEIRFSGEDMNDYTTLKIAEIVRSQSGLFSLREQYIPPSISISSSTYLKNFTTRIYEKLCAKSKSLSDRRGERTVGTSEFGSADMSNLWILYIVNSHIPILKHLCSSPDPAPETLYCMLAKLTGELMTFSSNSSPKDIPEYDHNDLANTFTLLEKKIDSFLQVVISSNFVPIPLTKSKENIFIANITDERLMDRARIYLSVGGDFPPEDIIKKIPRIVKISSANNIDLVINAGMTGAKINHVPMPPSAIPVRLGQQYFQIENFGEYWENIKESRAIAIYLPSIFSGAVIELTAVRE